MLFHRVKYLQFGFLLFTVRLDSPEGSILSDTRIRRNFCINFRNAEEGVTENPVDIPIRRGII